jgi:hypothetical protein
VLRLLSWGESSWVGVVTALVGLVAGVLLAAAVDQDSLTVTVDDDEVRLSKERKLQVFGRAEIGAVFLDGKQLALLATDTRELARDRHESTAEQVAEAFQRHGYPWTAADPHAADYRLWVEGTPDVAGAINALFRARRTALDEKRADEAADLGRELARLGYVLRDDGLSQYWRPVPSL